MVFEQFRTGLVFLLRLNTIFGFKYRASTRPRLQAFKIRLENESRVGPLMRQNLIPTLQHIKVPQINVFMTRWVLVLKL